MCVRDQLHTVWLRLCTKECIPTGDLESAANGEYPCIEAQQTRSPWVLHRVLTSRGKTSSGCCCSWCAFVSGLLVARISVPTSLLQPLLTWMKMAISKRQWSEPTPVHQADHSHTEEAPCCSLLSRAVFQSFSILHLVQEGEEMKTKCKFYSNRFWNERRSQQASDYCSVPIGRPSSSDTESLELLTES